MSFSGRTDLLYWEFFQAVELQFRGGFQRVWVFVSKDELGRVVSRYNGCWPAVKLVFGRDCSGD